MGACGAEQQQSVSPSFSFSSAWPARINFCRLLHSPCESQISTKLVTIGKAVCSYYPGRTSMTSHDHRVVDLQKSGHSSTPSRKTVASPRQTDPNFWMNVDRTAVIQFRKSMKEIERVRYVNQPLKFRSWTHPIPAENEHLPCITGITILCRKGIFLDE